ncbi:amino acid ABC transporter ATP-binding protein [Companilactobacillus nodensis]|uniref:amino acid ABC transporter ATP-binding protein n=1 Tax=Companilactobacillus nodensis TaxID=460870 RepID=UPI00077BA757|nr:amino acid ABC transporter ATP-binding protein [Companilactobacillus nodensis]
MEEIISVHRLVKSFDNEEVLRGVDLTVNRGEVVVVIGPSGSGKSTLLRCLIGLNDITSGEVWIEDDNFTNEVPVSIAARRKMGFVFQHFNLFPNLSVLDNITLSPIKNKIQTVTEAKTIAMELLKKVKLEDKINSAVSSLSGGEKQRIAIARALALSPEIMLFDEPTSALDPETVKDILNIIKKLSDTGMTMVIVTHEMSFAKEIADKVIFMDDGQILEVNSPDKLFNRPQNQRTKDFLNKIIYM